MCSCGGLPNLAHACRRARTSELDTRPRLLLAASILELRLAVAPARGEAIQRVIRSRGRAGGCAGCHLHMHACAHMQPAHLQLDRPAKLAHSAAGRRLRRGFGAPASRGAAERVSRPRIVGGRSAATLGRKASGRVAGQVEQHSPSATRLADSGEPKRWRRLRWTLDAAEQRGTRNAGSVRHAAGATERPPLEPDLKLA